MTADPTPEALTPAELRSKLRSAMATQAALSRTITALRAENEALTKGGIAEVAARNPSVMEYMAHWEARATAAEAERDALIAATLDRAAEWVENAWLGQSPYDAARAIRALATKSQADILADAEKEARHG